MKDLKPIIFLVPVVVLILISTLYFYLLKKTTDRKAYNKFIFIMITLSFLLNFAWELLQLPLYKNAAYNIEHIAFCALASIADVLMVLLLYFSFAFIFKDAFWIQDLQFKRVLLLIILGGVGAVLFEMRHLLLGSWAYDKSMPILPFVSVGITPVVQFMILPVLIYFISLRFIRKQKA